MTKIVSCKLAQVDIDRGMVRIPKEYRHLIKKKLNGKVEVYFNGSSKDLRYDKWGRIGFIKEWFKDLQPKTRVHIYIRNGGYEFKFEDYPQENFGSQDYKKILKKLFVKNRKVYSFEVIRRFWERYFKDSPISPDDLFDFMLWETSISIRYYNIVAEGEVLKRKPWRISKGMRWLFEVAVIPITIVIIQAIC